MVFVGRGRGVFFVLPLRARVYIYIYIVYCRGRGRVLRTFFYLFLFGQFLDHLRPGTLNLKPGT